MNTKNLINCELTSVLIGRTNMKNAKLDTIVTLPGNEKDIKKFLNFEGIDNFIITERENNSRKNSNVLHCPLCGFENGTGEVCGICINDL